MQQKLPKHKELKSFKCQLPEIKPESNFTSILFPKSQRQASYNFLTENCSSTQTFEGFTNRSLQKNSTDKYMLPNLSWKQSQNLLPSAKTYDLHILNQNFQKDLTKITRDYDKDLNQAIPINITYKPIFSAKDSQRNIASFLIQSQNNNIFQKTSVNLSSTLLQSEKYLYEYSFQANNSTGSRQIGSPQPNKLEFDSISHKVTQIKNVEPEKRFLKKNSKQKKKAQDYGIRQNITRQEERLKYNKVLLNLERVQKWIKKTQNSISNLNNLQIQLFCFYT